MSSHFPPDLPAVQLRFARQTDQLPAMIRFYRDGLGLPIIASFEGHAGYDGVMFGLPGAAIHLEFVQHRDGSPGTSPNQENLLVFYIPDSAAVRQKAGHLHALGYPPVPSENPYWDDHAAITIADPDGWLIVLMPTSGLSDR